MRHSFSGSRIIFSLWFSIMSWSLSAQSDYSEEVKAWQAEHNAEFKHPEKSPLSKKERKKFEFLEFFEIDQKYQITAKFNRTPNELPFTMPTTTDRLPVYVKYGIASFTLEGQTIELPIYQNLQLRESEEYRDYLFLPFTDETNGFASYGGGRYLDLRIPDGDSIVIDFNKAYNPYCAYNANYSCPIPPRDNDIALAIEAGVKAWEK